MTQPRFHFNANTGARLDNVEGEVQWKPDPSWERFRVRISEQIPNHECRLALPFAYGNIYSSTGSFEEDDIIIHTVFENRPGYVTSRFRENVHTTIEDYVNSNVILSEAVPRGLEEYVEIQPIGFGGHWISLKNYVVFVLDQTDRFPAFAVTHPKPEPRENAIPVQFPRVPGGISFDDEPEPYALLCPPTMPGPNGVVCRAMSEIASTDDSMLGVRIEPQSDMKTRAKEMRELCQELAADDSEDENDAVAAFAACVEDSPDSDLYVSRPALRQKQMPEWLNWEESHKTDDGKFKFPPAGHYWDPQRTSAYVRMVDLLTDYAYNDGRAPTPEELNLWEWVANTEADCIWVEIKKQIAEKDSTKLN